MSIILKKSTGPAAELQPQVVQKEGAEPVAAEVIAQSIVRIDEAMQSIMASGLKRNALVILLSALSKVGKREVEEVLAAMPNLRRVYTTK